MSFVVVYVAFLFLLLYFYDFFFAFGIVVVLVEKLSLELLKEIVFIFNIDLLVLVEPWISENRAHAIIKKLVLTGMFVKKRLALRVAFGCFGKMVGPFLCINLVLKLFICRLLGVCRISSWQQSMVILMSLLEEHCWKSWSSSLCVFRVKVKKFRSF